MGVINAAEGGVVVVLLSFHEPAIEGGGEGGSFGCCQRKAVVVLPWRVYMDQPMMEGVKGEVLGSGSGQRGARGRGQEEG